MKRTITLPLGELTVSRHLSGDTLLEVQMSGDLHLSLRLSGYAAGKLADALEDVNTNRLTVEEALELKTEPLCPNCEFPMGERHMCPDDFVGKGER